MVRSAQLLKIRRLLAICTAESAKMLSLVQSLLDLLVEVKDGEAEVVPELRITAQRIRCLLKVAEGQQVLSVLVKT